MMAEELILQARDLHLSYADSNHALTILQGLCLTVERGEFVAIIGSSGSGKSSLLHVLAGLLPLQQGTVCLCGHSLQASPNELASLRNRYLGFVYQAHHLMPELSAEENVALPLWVGGLGHRQALDRAHELLDHLGLAQRFSHLPGQLSGGEAQRVAVARALVGRPALVLADEPTGNLDEHTADEVFAALKELCVQEGGSSHQCLFQ